MKHKRAVLAAIMAVLFVLTALPISAANTEEGRCINSGVTIDTDPAGGYTGDYVVIYNPGDTAVGETTGSLAGKVVTDLTANVVPTRSSISTIASAL